MSCKIVNLHLQNIHYFIEGWSTKYSAKKVADCWSNLRKLTHMQLWPVDQSGFVYLA